MLLDTNDESEWNVKLLTETSTEDMLMRPDLIKAKGENKTA